MREGEEEGCGLVQGGVLVLGGVRSGKTAYGMGLAKASGRECVYVATGEGCDEEMESRILRHKEERDESWGLIEESGDLGGVIRRESRGERVLLVDCLTVWLGQAMYEGGEALMVSRVEDFLEAVRSVEGEGLVCVSSETGLGVVSSDKEVRMFVDVLGVLHQSLVGEFAHVRLVVAGCGLVLKG